MERLRIIGNVILQKNGLFSAKQISEETKVRVGEVQVVLDRLFREGLVQRYRFESEFAPARPGRPKARIIYQVANRKKMAKRVSPKLKEGTVQDRIWRVIRAKQQIEGHFTRADLVYLAEASPATVIWFTKLLHRAGIVRPSRRSGAGVVWRLVKDPGPNRPHVAQISRRSTSANE
jgi:predicted transcriptional regulator